MTNGRRFICVRCHREVGKHGYSDMGSLANHKCSHGLACKPRPGQWNQAACIICERARTPEKLQEIKRENERRKAAS